AELILHGDKLGRHGRLPAREEDQQAGVRPATVDPGLAPVGVHRPQHARGTGQHRRPDNVRSADAASRGAAVSPAACHAGIQALGLDGKKGGGDPNRGWGGDGMVQRDGCFEIGVHGVGGVRRAERDKGGDQLGDAYGGVQDVDVRPGPRRGVGHGGSVEGDLSGLGASRDRLDRDRVVCLDGHVLARHQVRDAPHRQRVGRAEAGKLCRTPSSAEASDEAVKNAAQPLPVRRASTIQAIPRRLFCLRLCPASVLATLG
ncbi:unnamed protein product, partial [Ectocarpus sp. 4 AP-2014]